METAATIITDAMQLILVQASESEIEADEAQSAIRFLNRMMDKLAASGINLGYSRVSNLADQITVPDGAIDGIISNLALAIAPLYLSPGESVSTELRIAAVDGLETMRKLGVSFSDMQLPCTLPQGSGNYDNCNTGQTFYPCTDEQILSEINQAVLTEDNTEV